MKTPENMVKLLRTLAYATMTALQNATVVGNPAPIVEQLRARMKAPKPGDWVVEVYGMYKQSPQGMGILVATQRECARHDWNEEEDGPCPMEDAWYLETPEGEFVRWRDCELLAIPNMPNMGPEWIADARRRLSMLVHVLETI